MNQGQINVTENKRSSPDMINTIADDTEGVLLLPPLKKQKIEESNNDNNNNIMLNDNYYESTCTCCENTVIFINEDGNLVTIGGLVHDNEENPILEHKAIVLKIDGFARKVGLQEDKLIFINNNEGKIIEIYADDDNLIVYKKNQKFGSDLDFSNEKDISFTGEYKTKEISYSYWGGFRLLTNGTLEADIDLHTYLLGIGIDEDEDLVNDHAVIKLEDKIDMIAFSGRAVICKTEKDEFYAWGSVSNKMLPIDMSLHKHNESYFSKPILCSNMPMNVISIKISFSNMIFLTQEGLVYKTGFESLNKKGKSIFSEVPKLIENIPLIKKISSYSVNFSLLDDNGNIWTFSKYNIYELSKSSSANKLHCDIKLPFIPPMIKRDDVKNIIDISEGGERTFIKTEFGDIFYFNYTNAVLDTQQKNRDYNILNKVDEDPSIWRTNKQNSRKKSARK